MVFMLLQNRRGTHLLKPLWDTLNRHEKNTADYVRYFDGKTDSKFNCKTPDNIEKVNSLLRDIGLNEIKPWNYFIYNFIVTTRPTTLNTLYIFDKVIINTLSNEKQHLYNLRNGIWST